jgi:xanthine dehydrogenase accessory factor
MLDIYEEIVKLKKEGKSGALATVIAAKGSTPREEGSKMLVRSDGTIVGSIGGGNLEALVQKAAREIIAAGKAQTVHYDLSARDAGEVGMICGGVTDILIEPIIPAAMLYIFGAGHISIPLSIIGKMLDFAVTVVDDRDDFANQERFPAVDEIYAEDLKQVFSKLSVNASSYIVIVTRGHAYDEVVLEWALTTPAYYIGMIGSKTKNQTIFNHLKQRGATQKTLDRVHAPIGLKISAETPEEIAVSIMAEIIQVKRAPSGSKDGKTSESSCKTWHV